MKEMFKGKVNSPITYLKEAVTQEGNILYLASNSILPDELPNLLVIGEDENAETVKVLNTRADGGLDVERGFQGISKAWPKTTQVARNITEYDIRALQDNVKELNENKVEKVEGKKLSSEDYTAEEKEEVKKIKEKIDIAKLNNNFEDILEIVDEETLKSFVPTINVIKTLFENIPQPVLASLTEDGLLSKELFSVINKIPEDAKYTDTVYSLATALKDGLLSKELFNKLNDLQLATTIKDGLLSKEMFEKLENFEGVQGVSNANLNNLIMTGFYTVSNANNIPEGFNGTGGVLVYRFAKGAPELFGTIQMYVDFNGRVAIRAAQGESDNNWKEIGGRSKSSIIGLAGEAIYATTNDNTANLNTGSNMVKLETISTLQLPLEIIPSNSAFGYGWNITKNMPCIIKILDNAKVSVTTIGEITNSSQDDICFSMTYVL